MKKNLLLLVISMMLNSSFAVTQNPKIEQSDTIPTVQVDTIKTSNPSSEDKAIVQMLIEFYTVYDKTWKEVNDPHVVWMEKIDSLRQKYCTQRLRMKLKDLEKQWGGFEHDILTCDFGIEYSESLRVIKDNKMENTYWVSYTAIAGPYPEKEKNSDVEIKIQIVVVKEDEVFKIDDILNPESCFCD